MPNYAPTFSDMVRVYRTYPLEFPQLRAITLAQWILESGRGFSPLSQQFNNFAGLKYREEMVGFAAPVYYNANDGGDYYCAFDNEVMFIQGFWRFLDRRPYWGWRQNCRTAEQYLNFIAPRYSTNPAYVDKVLNLLPEAYLLLGINTQPPDTDVDDHDGPGTSEPHPKPLIAAFVESPNMESRNGQQITRVIMHCSDKTNLNEILTAYRNPASQRSVHYLIDKNGKLYQLVRDSDRAWHCKGANSNSIGIELVATRNDVMTAQQNTTVIALIRWLLSAYRIRTDQISGHRYTAGYAGGINGTACPGRLFGDTSDAALKRWVSQNFWAAPPATNTNTNPNPTNPNIATNTNSGSPTGGRWDF